MHCGKELNTSEMNLLTCINYQSMFKTLCTYPWLKDNLEGMCRKLLQTDMKALGKGISKPVVKGNEIHMERQREIKCEFSSKLLYNIQMN